MKDFKTINCEHSWEISLETYPGARHLAQVIELLNSGGFCYRLIVDSKETTYYINGTEEKLLVPANSRCLLSMKTGKLLAVQGSLVRVLVYKNTATFVPAQRKPIRWINF